MPVTVGTLRDCGLRTAEIESLRAVYGSRLGDELTPAAVLVWAVGVLPWSAVAADGG